VWRCSRVRAARAPPKDRQAARADSGRAADAGAHKVEVRSSKSEVRKD
jgi:hypothetical protein